MKIKAHMILIAMVLSTASSAFAYDYSLGFQCILDCEADHEDRVLICGSDYNPISEEECTSISNEILHECIEGCPPIDDIWRTDMRMYMKELRRNDKIRRQ